MKKRELTLVFLVWVLASALVFSYFNLSFDITLLGLLYSLVALCGIHLLWAWNWKVLNKAAGLKHEYKTLFKGTFIAAFTDTVTPQLTPSAELATSYYLKNKFGKKPIDYFPIVFLESTAAFLCQILLFLLATIMIGQMFTTTSLYLVGALAVFFAVSLLAWKLRRIIMKDILKLSMGQVETLGKVMDGIVSLTSKRKKLLARMVLVILLSLLIEASVVYVLIMGLNEASVYALIANPYLFLIVVVAFMGSRILTLFTLIPGGIGINEISMSAMLISMSAALPVNAFEPAIVLSAVIVYRTLFFWLNIFIGSYFAGSEVFEWVSSLNFTNFLKKH